MKVNVNPRHDIVQKAAWKPTWQWQCRSLLRFHLGNLPMFCTWHLWTPHSYENRVRTPLLQQRVAHSWLTSASFNKANPWVQRVQGEWIDLTLDNDHDPCDVCRLTISTCYPPIIKHSNGKIPDDFPMEIYWQLQTTASLQQLCPLRCRRPCAWTVPRSRGERRAPGQLMSATLGSGNSKPVDIYRCWLVDKKGVNKKRVYTKQFIMLTVDVYWRL